MSFEVTVTPTVYNVEVEVNPSVQPFDVQVMTNQDLEDLVEEAKQYAEDAEDSADSASASASSASASATTATNQANIATNQALLASAARLNAQNAANAAEDSADASAVSASSALASATSAELDAIATAADRVQTGLDRVATGADRVQTGLDRVATGADRVQTGIDANTASTQAGVATTQAGIATTQAGIATTQAGNALTSANNALNSANAAAASAASAAQVGTSTLLTGFATGANSTILSTDTILGAFQKAQGQINARVSGTGVAGQVAFWSGTGTQSGDSNFRWDNTNKRGEIGLAFNSALIPTGVSYSLVTSFQNVQSAFANLMASDTATHRPSFFGVRSRGTLTSPTLPLAGDNATALISGVWDSTAVLASAGVFFELESNAATNNVPQLINLVTGSTAANRTTKLQVRSNGNVLIQNGGTFTDAGFRLDVNGTARVQGALSVTTGADVTPLTISGYSLTGANAQSALSITGTWNTTGTPTALLVNITNTASNSNSLLMDLQVGGSSIFIVNRNGFTRAVNYVVGGSSVASTGNNAAFERTGGNGVSSGTHRAFISSMSVVPTSGTAIFNQFEVLSTINQTGGANGITRGLFVNPTLTAAADWRSIEWSNNTGWGLYGVGTALNYLNGNLLLGSTTSTGERLQVTGTTRLSATADSVPLTISGYSLTGSNAQSALSITGTWNTTGTPTALLVNITDTASNANSLLFDYQVGGVSRIRGNKSGVVRALVGFALDVNNIAGIFAALTSSSEVTIRSATLPTTTNIDDITFSNGQGEIAITSGSRNLIRVTRGANPTSGNGIYNIFHISPTINQTGGASGITRGIIIAPTLTAAADWRSIEWSNNTGRGLWGVGTANNAMAGALNVGSASNANASAILELTSTTRGLLLPRMTSAERDAIASPVAGLVVYNTTDNKISWYNGTAWANI